MISLFFDRCFGEFFRKKAMDKKEMDVVSFIRNRVNEKQKVSLYETCFIAMEAINSSVLTDTRSLIAKSNEFYSTDSTEEKNKILRDVAKILSRYNELNNGDIDGIEKFLLSVTRRNPRKSNTRLLTLF